MRGRATLSAVAAFAAMAVLSSCASTADAAGVPDEPPSSPGIVVPTDARGMVTPVPDGTVDADTGEVVTQEQVPTWTDESRAQAVAAAEAAMTAFARPQMNPDEWWAELQPLLSRQAGQDYAYVVPSSVPASKVTGAGSITDDASAYVAVVSVPTDVGPYTVVLSRTDGAARWLADRITPPEGIN